MNRKNNKKGPQHKIGELGQTFPAKKANENEIQNCKEAMQNVLLLLGKGFRMHNVQDCNWLVTAYH